VYQVHNKKGFFRAESRASGNRQSIGSNFTTAEEAAEALRLYDEEHGPRLRKEAEERQAKLEAERVERSLTSSKRKKRAIDDCWVEEDLLAEIFEEDADHVKGYGTRGKKKESEETPEIRQLQMKAMRTVAQSEERVNIAEIKAKEQEKRIRELELELNMEKSKRISLETEIAKLKDGTESEKHKLRWLKIRMLYALVTKLEWFLANTSSCRRLPQLYRHLTCNSTTPTHTSNRPPRHDKKVDDVFFILAVLLSNLLFFYNYSFSFSSSFL